MGPILAFSCPRQVLGGESKPGTASVGPQTVYEGLEKSYKRLRTGCDGLETGFHRLMIGSKELEAETGSELLERGFKGDGDRFWLVENRL